MSKIANEPAFPYTIKFEKGSNKPDGTPWETPVQMTFCGLSIRQHFAALAMQGMIASGEFSLGYHALNIEQLGVTSVQCADALLKALEK